MVTVKLQRKDEEWTKECEFADMTFSGVFAAKFADDRRFPEIASDWDQLDCITVVESLKETSYAGLSQLVHLHRDDDGLVFVKIAKEDTKDE